jgi:hypothetical protein
MQKIWTLATTTHFKIIDHNKVTVIHYFDGMKWLRWQAYSWQPSLITQASSSFATTKGRVGGPDGRNEETVGIMIKPKGLTREPKRKDVRCF